MLAVGLRCRNALAGPLWEMYQREALSGDWLGAELRTALRSALIHNQIDQRLETLWLNMSIGIRDAFLGGNAYIGCEGASKMPDPKRLLGRALKGLAQYLEDSDDRRVAFRTQLERVSKYQPSSTTSLSLDFITMADENEWPAWTIPCLPRLYHPLKDSGRKNEKSTRTYLLWKPYIKILSWMGDLDFSIGREICHGQVAIVHMEIESAKCFDPVGQEAEELRRINPYQSDSSLICVILHGLAEVAWSAGNNERVTKCARSAHKVAVSEWRFGNSATAGALC